MRQPAVQALEIFPYKSLKSPPLAGLLAQVKGLRVPNLVILRPAVPKFFARSRHYSRFLEKRNVTVHSCIVDEPGSRIAHGGHAENDQNGSSALF